MGEDWSGQVCVGNSQERLPVGLCNPSSIDKNPVCISPFFTSSYQGGYFTTGQSFDRQGGSRNSAGCFNPRLLQPIFCSPQEGQFRLAFDSGSLKSQLLPGQREIQNGNCRDYQDSSLSERLDNFARSQRRILSCSDPSSSSKVSAFLLPGTGSSVQGSSDGSFGFSQDIQQSDRQRQEVCTVTRVDSSPVLGRLAGESSIQGASTSTHSLCSRDLSETRFDYQSEEIRAETISEADIFGLSTVHGGGFSTSNQGSLSENSQVFETNVDCEHSPSKVLATGIRTVDGDGKVSTQGYVSHPSNSNSTTEQVVTILGRSRGGNPHQQRSKTISSMVDEDRTCVSGITFQDRGAQVLPLVGCHSKRMGRSFKEGSRSGRLLDGVREETSYQRLGADGCRKNVDSLSGLYQEQDSADISRQHYGGGVSPKTGWHEIPTVTRCSSQDFPVDGGLSGDIVMQTYPGQAQREGRQDISRRSDSANGVVTTSSSGGVVVASMGSSTDRHVCYELQSQATKLCVADSGRQSHGGGCSLIQLGEPVHICISPDGDPSTSHHKDQERQLLHDFDSSFVAQTGLVPRSSRVDNRFSKKSASSSKASEAASIEHLSHSARGVQAPRVDIIAEHIQKKGFSKETAQRMSRPQRQSTIDVYQSKWEGFSNWCHSRKIDPIQASVVEVSDFLVYLHEERHLAYSTIEGFRAAISQVLFATSDLDLSDNYFINRLMSNFSKQKTSKSNKMPEWDLSLVLQALKEGPFEPMRKANLKWVTLKTVFLIALASAKRRGELHAIRFSTFSRKEDWSSVTLRPDAKFVSKTELAGRGQFALKPIVIQAIKLAEGHDKETDRKLCPVRALKLYLRATTDLREGKEKLFVSFKKGHNQDICKNTVSFWLRKAIFCAYEESSVSLKRTFKVKAHDIRGLAASWAFLRNVALDEVMDACSWRSSNTFIRHYLKDMEEVSGSLHRLGPLVVAQHQV